MAKAIFIILLATLSVSAQNLSDLTHYKFNRELTVKVTHNGWQTHHYTRSSSFITDDTGSLIEQRVKSKGKLPFTVSSKDWLRPDGILIPSPKNAVPKQWTPFRAFSTSVGEVKEVPFPVPVRSYAYGCYWVYGGEQDDTCLKLEATYHSYREFGSRLTVKEVDGEELKPIIGTYMPKRAPEVVYPTWKHGSTVGVVIVGFSEKEIAAIQLAIDGWNALGLIKFEIRSSGELRVIREETLKGSGLDSYFLGVSDGTILESGTMAIDPKVKDSKALISHASHELGHSLGMSDCNDCKSIMRRPFRGVNGTNGYLSPTDVDLVALGLKVVSKRE